MRTKFRWPTRRERIFALSCVILLLAAIQIAVPPVRNFLTGWNEPEESTHIRDRAHVASARAQLITEIFAGALPQEMGLLSPTASPVAGLSDLQSTDQIVMKSYPARPKLWRPAVPNGDLVLLHQGHSFSYNEGNYGAVLQQLLSAGFTVCGLVMPGGDADRSGSSHAHNSDHPSLDEFIGPVVIAVNTLAPNFTTIHMIGLSGGAWTTVLAAAMDTRIRHSYQIAGTFPLYIALTGPGQRDWEQMLPGLSASYQDLYLLGSCCSGRRQKQILYANDPCCFNAADYRRANSYAEFIAELAKDLGGEFDLVWIAKDSHEWDTAVIEDEVLPEIWVYGDLT